MAAHGITLAKSVIKTQTPQKGAASFRLGYRPALDGLRGVAVLLVMLHHSGIPFARGAWLGVDIFFVLSGFLITTILVQEWESTGCIHLGHFYARRALRLLPAFIVLMIVLAVAATLVQGTERALLWKTFPTALLYVSNWALAFQWIPQGPLVHTWSLAIEEQFYLLWPPLLSLLLCRRVDRRRLVAYVVSTACGVAVLRALLWHHTRSVSRVHFGFDTRADALLWGCVLGLMATSNILPGSSGLLSAASAGASALLVALVLLGIKYSGYMYDGGLSIIAIASAVIIVQLIIVPDGLAQRLATFRPLVWMGRLSYGFYLWHWPIVYASVRVFNLRSGGLTRHLLALLAEVVVTFTLVPLSYYCIERPFLRSKLRYTVMRPTSSSDARVTGQSSAPSKWNT